MIIQQQERRDIQDVKYKMYCVCLFRSGVLQSYNMGMQHLHDLNHLGCGISSRSVVLKLT